MAGLKEKMIQDYHGRFGMEKEKGSGLGNEER